MMLPDFLKPYEADIEKQKLECISIAATMVKDEEQLPLRQSKFLGRPFLPVDVEYPKGKDGMPMLMLAQINFSEFEALAGYPDKGILQLFVSATDWYSEKDYKIIYHSETTAQEQTDFDFLNNDALYDESPIEGEHRLQFEKKYDYGGSEDFRFALTFDGKSYWDYSEELNRAQQEEIYKVFNGGGHKIGGYAEFTQSDPRGYDKELKNDVLLLQIDTDDHIMFGDSGIAHIFINKEDLKALNFERAYFHWDCC